MKMDHIWIYALGVHGWMIDWLIEG